MNILVACEFSGMARDAFRAKGHNAVSCDLEPSEKPGPHYQGDVRDILDDSWDMLVAFPPCTYLSYAGIRHWNVPGRREKRGEAIAFARLLWNAPIPHIALENPLGILSKAIRKPDQIIHPYHFGHAEMKRTCLWLRGLPPLICTCVELHPKEFVTTLRHDKNRGTNRSRTFSGIAQAMADQWLEVLA